MGNGIWQNLYQFPLIETSKVVNLTLIKKNQEFMKMVNGKEVFNYQNYIIRN